jgi:hypothetical protein
MQRKPFELDLGPHLGRKTIRLIPALLVSVALLFVSVLGLAGMRYMSDRHWCRTGTRPLLEGRSCGPA